MTTKADQAVDRGADKLEELAERTVAEGGVKKPGEPRRAPAGPQLGERPRARKRKGQNPWAVLGGAIVGGYFIAKVVDWRGHADPRD